MYDSLPAERKDPCSLRGSFMLTSAGKCGESVRINDKTSNVVISLLFSFDIFQIII